MDFGAECNEFALNRSVLQAITILLFTRAETVWLSLPQTALILNPRIGSLAYIKKSLLLQHYINLIIDD